MYKNFNCFAQENVKKNPPTLPPDCQNSPNCKSILAYVHFFCNFNHCQNFDTLLTTVICETGTNCPLRDSMACFSFRR